jgi:Ca2+-binding EF-hand superfamily protein
LFKPLLSSAALILLASGAPLSAAAAAQAAKPAAAQPAKPAAAAQAPTRANLVKQTDGAFKSIDTNADGTLSAAELGVAEGKVQQQRIAQLRSRAEAEFAKLDTNKDGQLSKAEFMAVAPAPSSATPNGAAIVTQLDKNKDGKVTADEFRAPRLTAFDRIDTNHDGTLSQAERQAAQKR